MNVTVFIPVLFLLVVHTEARLYTLEQLIDQALKNSTELQLSKKNIKYTDIEIQELYSQSFPSILFTMHVRHLFSSSILYSWLHEYELNEGITGYTGTRQITPGMQSYGLLNPSGWDDDPYGDHITMSGLFAENSLVSSVVVVQPVFLQGKNYLRLKMARSTQAIAVCAYEDIKSSIIAETTKKYYTLLLEQQRWLFRMERVALLDEQYRLAKVNYTMAHASDTDTLESLLLLEQANLDAIHAESQRNNAAEALIVQTGVVETALTFYVDDKLPEPVFFVTIEEAIARLYEANAQIKQFKGKEKIQNLKISIAKSDYLPVIYLGGAISKIGTTSETQIPLHLQWEDERKIFAGIAWNLFTGFRTQRRVERQVNLNEQLHISHQKTIDQLELKTRLLHADILVMKQRLTILRKMIELSEKKLHIATVAYTNGNGTAYTQKKAELDIQTSILTYTEQLYFFHIAVTDFKYLIGCLHSF